MTESSGDDNMLVIVIQMCQLNMKFLFELLNAAFSNSPFDVVVTLETLT
jgi:hypothetical protein